VGAEDAVERPAGDERSAGDRQQATHRIGGRCRARRDDATERRRGHDEEDLLDDQHDVGHDPHRPTISHVAQQLLGVRHTELDDDGDQPADDEERDPVRGERPAGGQVHAAHRRPARILT
jgi:hypothetical protein